MKKSISILASALFMLFMTSTTLSAQYAYDYDYDDTVIIIHDNDNDKHYNRNNGRNNQAPRRNGDRIQQERRWKEKIMRRAYAIAEADGRVTKRERRELLELERDLGIHRRAPRNHRR